MKNWARVEDRWMNMDHLTELWVEKNSFDQYVIMACAAADISFELFVKVFERQVDALNYLLNFMKENGRC